MPGSLSHMARWERSGPGGIACHAPHQAEPAHSSPALAAASQRARQMPTMATQPRLSPRCSGAASLTMSPLLAQARKPSPRAEPATSSAAHARAGAGPMRPMCRAPSRVAPKLTMAHSALPMAVPAGPPASRTRAASPPAEAPIGPAARPSATAAATADARRAAPGPEKRAAAAVAAPPAAAAVTL